MAERTNAEAGLIDAWTAGLGGPRTGALLDRLEAAVPWAKLATPILALPEYRPVKKGEDNKGGRPAWPAVTMLKCVMLAKWFGLSDPQLEECLKDRLSFRRFVGLSLSDSTPDETTFVRFRTRLEEAKLDRRLFDATVGHLDGMGLVIKDGTLVDATIIEQARGKKREDGTSTRDEEASFTKKNGETYHGYKGHIAADLSGIVTDYRFGTAKEHDSNHIDDLTMHERQLVLADSAYSSAARRTELRARGVIDGIIYKRHRGQDRLHRWQERWNRMVARLRARVEHPSAMLKHQLGYRRVRYRGRERNAFDFALILTACNIKRSLSLRIA